MTKEDLELFLAMQDDEFQKIIETDPVILDLESLKNDIHSEYLEIMTVISKKLFIGGVAVKPITPIMLAYLFTIENGILHKKPVTQQDIDVFLYILHFGINGISENLYVDAKDFCFKNNLDLDFAFSEISEMLKLAFRGAELINGNSDSNQEIRFNLDWLTMLVGIVSGQTNKDSDYIIFNMSLTECFYYILQYIRKNSTEKHIRRNSDQINEQIFKRTYELGKEYYYNKYKGMKENA